MPVYLLTYDLIAKDGEQRDYGPLYKAIDQFPNHQVLYSVFGMDAPSAAAIEIAIVPALRKNDRYFITRLRANQHRYRVIPGFNQWLLAHPLV
jgi:hypothetical protein